MWNELQIVLCELNSVDIDNDARFGVQTPTIPTTTIKRDFKAHLYILDYIRFFYIYNHISTFKHIYTFNISKIWPFEMSMLLGLSLIDIEIIKVKYIKDVMHIFKFLDFW